MVRGRDGLTGALLVGGASRRFGSPKALARIDGETLAERCHSVLASACDDVIVVGKTADGLALPFPVLDDGYAERASIVGVAASLRLARSDLVLVLPTDMPWMTPEALGALAAAAGGRDVAIPHTGPLPGAYRRSALAIFAQRIARGELGLRDALADLDTRVVDLDERLLANVNTRADLEGPA